MTYYQAAGDQASSASFAFRRHTAGLTPLSPGSLMDGLLLLNWLLYPICQLIIPEKTSKENQALWFQRNDTAVPDLHVSLPEWTQGDSNPRPPQCH